MMAKVSDMSYTIPDEKVKKSNQRFAVAESPVAGINNYRILHLFCVGCNHVRIIPVCPFA